MVCCLLVAGAWAWTECGLEAGTRRLESVLESAAMHVADDGPAVIVTHLVVLTIDRGGYELCMRLGLHCFYDTQEDAGEKDDYGRGELTFMSPAYLHMLWRRVELLRHISRLGYNLLFTDNDILWFQDPFPHLAASGEDMQFACDIFQWDHTTLWPNAGFFYARSTNRTHAFFDYWLANHSARFPGKNEQDVYKQLRPEVDPFTANSIGLTVKYLRTTKFGGFCESGSDLEELVTMHANCCVGLDKKLGVLRKIMADHSALMSVSVETRAELKMHNMIFLWTPRNCTIN
eukprot:jgi/Mesen1/2957/ME000176S01997